jgi:hypothetical protein
MVNQKLEVGEKYISVVAGGLNFALFKNKNKKNPKDPDYTGQIKLAAWVNEKKDKADDPKDDLL